MPLIFLVVFGSFACLFPLAFYCLVVASLNHRRQPTLVPGPVDFAGVLLATAGFLIVGGPMILAGVHDAWVRSIPHGSFTDAFDTLVISSERWILLWVGYFVLVVGGSAWLLWRRRTVSVVYNLHAATAHALISETLDRLGVSWTRRAGVYYLGFGLPEMGMSPAAHSVPAVSVGRAALEVTAAPALRHVTLRWTYGGGSLRSAFEAELHRALERVVAPENPAAGWFLGVAMVLFVVLLVLLALFIVFLWNLSR